MIATHRLTGFKGSLWPYFDTFDLQDLDLNDVSESLQPLLQAIKQRDEKLDLLSAFLADAEPSGHLPHPTSLTEPSVQDRLSTFLYRQMILEQIVSIPYQPAVIAPSVPSEKGEEELNFHFALTAYLKTFLLDHQACLDFLRGIMRQAVCPQTPPVLAAPLP